jgi:hypothetical protein
VSVVVRLLPIFLHETMSNEDEEEARHHEETRGLRDEEASMAVLEESRRLGEEKQEDFAELASRFQALEMPTQEDIAELLRRLQVSESLRQGQYYATVDKIWGTKSEMYNNTAFFTALKREKAPSFMERGASMDVYVETKKFALDKKLLAVDDKAYSSIPSQKKIDIWPEDIFGNKPDGADIAHLIPASSNNAAQYFDVVMWALGFPSGTVWDALQKAIHGAKTKGRRGKRKAHIGIKHSVSNKIRLSGQAEFFDEKPCVFIIPIMDLDEAKLWNGEGYSALVMCEKFEGTDASTACRKIEMIDEGRVALEAWEIEKSRQLLEAVILGMAYSLGNCSEGIVSRLDKYSKKDKFRDLREVFLSKTGIEGVIVPEARQMGTPDSPSVESLKVRVVKFSDHTESKGVAGFGHPAPDPLLLAVKAAINWSRKNYQHLRAAAEPPKEDDERDVLAHEEYIQWRNDQLRPKSWDDLARGLGQPLGYQGDDGVNA